MPHFSFGLIPCFFTRKENRNIRVRSGWGMCIREWRVETAALAPLVGESAKQPAKKPCESSHDSENGIGIYRRFRGKHGRKHLRCATVSLAASRLGEGRGFASFFPIRVIREIRGFSRRTQGWETRPLDPAPRSTPKQKSATTSVKLKEFLKNGGAIHVYPMAGPSGPATEKQRTLQNQDPRRSNRAQIKPYEDITSTHQINVRQSRWSSTPHLHPHCQLERTGAGAAD